jgi:hypothetical protein
MNYSRIYSQLINKGRNRVFEGYAEKHHIIPKCVGGSDNPSNLVRLTPEEHYIAHLLLVKIYPGNSKLIYAANMMANRNNKSYGWIKREFGEHIREHNKSWRPTDDIKERISKAHKGRNKSENWKTQMSKIKTKTLEYKSATYLGYEELQQATGVSRHLYTKFYLKGIDPTPYINNRTYGWVANVKANPPKAALGKKWYNNSQECRYFDPGQEPHGWVKGRLRYCSSQEDRQ